MQLRKKLGVDLGTATVLIYVEGKGIVLQEPSVVAVQKKTNKVLCVGQEAKDLLGRTPQSIEAIRPLREGVISDFEATEVLLTALLEKANKSWIDKLLKPTVCICIPSKISPVERRAVEDTCHQIGMGKVILISEPIAAALGANLDITKPEGHLVVDIGGGTTDVSVISLCEPIIDATIKVAGDVFDHSIIRYMRKEYNLLIGEKTAENVKCTIGCAYPTKINQKMSVRGRNLLTGMPGEQEITTQEVLQALTEPLMHILETIRSVLDETPPELMSDISDSGILLTGGGAMLKGLDQLIEKKTGLKTILAADPVTCVVRGTKKALGMPQFFVD